MTSFAIVPELKHPQWFERLVNEYLSLQDDSEKQKLLHCLIPLIAYNVWPNWSIRVSEIDGYMDKLNFSESVTIQIMINENQQVGMLLCIDSKRYLINYDKQKNALFPHDVVVIVLTEDDTQYDMCLMWMVNLLSCLGKFQIDRKWVNQKIQHINLICDEFWKILGRDQDKVLQCYEQTHSGAFCINFTWPNAWNKFHNNFADDPFTDKLNTSNSTNSNASLTEENKGESKKTSESLSSTSMVSNQSTLFERHPAQIDKNLSQILPAVPWAYIEWVKRFERNVHFLDIEKIVSGDISSITTPKQAGVAMQMMMIMFITLNIWQIMGSVDIIEESTEIVLLADWVIRPHFDKNTQKWIIEVIHKEPSARHEFNANTTPKDQNQPDCFGVFSALVQLEKLLSVSQQHDIPTQLWGETNFKRMKSFFQQIVCFPITRVLLEIYYRTRNPLDSVHDRGWMLSDTLLAQILSLETAITWPINCRRPLTQLYYQHSMANITKIFFEDPQPGTNLDIDFIWMQMLLTSLVYAGQNQSPTLILTHWDQTIHVPSDCIFICPMIDQNQIMVCCGNKEKVYVVGMTPKNHYQQFNFEFSQYTSEIQYAQAELIKIHSTVLQLLPEFELKLEVEDVTHAIDTIVSYAYELLSLFAPKNQSNITHISRAKTPLSVSPFQMTSASLTKIEEVLSSTAATQNISNEHASTSVEKSVVTPFNQNRFLETRQVDIPSHPTQVFPFIPTKFELPINLPELMKINIHPLLGSLEPRINVPPETEWIDSQGHSYLLYVRHTPQKTNLHELRTELSTWVESLPSLTKKPSSSSKRSQQTMFRLKSMGALQQEYLQFYADAVAVDRLMINPIPPEAHIKLKFPGLLGVSELIDLSNLHPALLYEIIKNHTPIFYSIYDVARDVPLLWKAGYYLHKNQAILAAGAVFAFLHQIGIPKPWQKKIYAVMGDIKTHASKRYFYKPTPRSWWPKWKS
jgi:hypothetical protein